MKILLTLLIGLCLVSCKNEQPVQEDKFQPFLSLQIDETSLPAPPSCIIITPANWIKRSLHEASAEKGIPLHIYAICNGENHSIFWTAIVGVDGVEDRSTLECIANTLIEISFIRKVSNKDFQISK